MQSWKEYFKGKKITVMGLGLLGRGVGDIAFLAKNGADLIVTDLKSEKELEPSLKKLNKYKNIIYRLGEHDVNDFRGRDFILKAAGVPLDSPYIAEAKNNGIPIEMSASLFAKLVDLPIIGVTGTRGKSTVTHLLFHILKIAKKEILLGGNVKGVSTLSLLSKAKSADYALFELDSWQLQGFGESRISPSISVFTNFLDDHLSYYKGDRKKYFDDKANIFKYQKKGDFLVVGKQVLEILEKFSGGNIPNKPIVSPEKINGFPSNLLGEHNSYNIALAIITARILGIKDEIIKKAVKSFKGVPGRLELIRKVKGVSFYNDTTATTPDATLAALQALKSKNKNLKTNLILIMGGSDKSLDMSKLSEALPIYCKKVIFLEGTGTQKFEFANKEIFKDLKSAIAEAYKNSKKGDIILMSPAFASFGMFKNEFDRGEQFVKLVKKLK